MSQKLNTAIAVIGIDIGKNSFHVVGHDQRGAIVLHQKWSRGQVFCREGSSTLARMSQVAICYKYKVSCLKLLDTATGITSFFGLNVGNFACQTEKMAG
jgi:hypothetical protein